LILLHRPTYYTSVNEVYLGWWLCNDSRTVTINMHRVILNKKSDLDTKKKIEIKETIRFNVVEYKHRNNLTVKNL